jgi:hypothetical protein
METGVVQGDGNVLGMGMSGRAGHDGLKEV